MDIPVCCTCLYLLLIPEYMMLTCVPMLRTCSSVRFVRSYPLLNSTSKNSIASVSLWLFPLLLNITWMSFNWSFKSLSVRTSLILNVSAYVLLISFNAFLTFFSLASEIIIFGSSTNCWSKLILAFCASSNVISSGFVSLSIIIFIWGTVPILFRSVVRESMKLSVECSLWYKFWRYGMWIGSTGSWSFLLIAWIINSIAGLYLSNFGFI